MATSAAVPPNDGPSGNRLFGKTGLVLAITLLALLIVCATFLWTTRGAMTYLHGKAGAHGPGEGQSLVDVQPWQTAQALASLAVTSEENEYARQAEHLADHEVDQAFAAALRQARLDTEHRKLSGDALALSQKVAQLQQLKQQDQAMVDGLAAAANPHGAAARNSVSSASASDDLEVAKAQLGLDSDELTDTQRDLARAAGDHSEEIQNELAAHEESMKKYDSEVESGQIAVVSARQDQTLASRIGAWFRQRQRAGLIKEALGEAQNDAHSLTEEHNALETKANAAAAAGAVPDRTTQLANLKDRSIERQILSIDDDRIQTEQQLATLYSKWEDQVKLQHVIVLHLILQSFMAILAILAGIFLCDALVRRIMDRTVTERRQMRTLRNVLELGIQALGVIIILIVIFGPPKETPTILGLTTAALTIALQDYILAFLGWFVLMGKNGIHVGDWVEINGVCGEVHEIGLMTTTLLETSGLADQGYPTGRRISFMNGFAIRGQYFNFSTAGQWTWDEISVSVPQSADVHAVMEQVQKAVAEETHENATRAEHEWKHATREGSLSRISAAPVVSVRPSGSGIDLQIRYVTAASDRFAQRNRLYQHVAEMFQEQASAKR
ncbi:MscS Mechanosensitive ion channel [Candidatus Sulfotelmatomonas gaucii]|uniref:MscS Mechanosensitive ion channel n=1 Tax=Candidatus Sulfuritelmatomonas gaucii TaxID=2043161 RepID=A0A2N9L2X0_9BACT|nr:MscS Mechanosensitive ion channel [Candidatus Sulfotelmatomonas gaucii]